MKIFRFAPYFHGLMSPKIKKAPCFHRMLSDTVRNGYFASASAAPFPVVCALGARFSVNDSSVACLALSR